MAIKVKKREPGIRIDPGVYAAVATGVEQGHHDKNGDYLLWKFKITDEVTKDGEEVEDAVTMTCITSMSWSKSKKNKLNKLMVATGVDVDDYDIDDEFDVEEIVGEALRLVVEDSEKEDATYSKVVSFMPLAKKKKKKKVEEEEEKPKKKKKHVEEDDDDEEEKPKKKKKPKDEDDEEEKPKKKKKPKDEDEDDDDDSDEEEKPKKKKKPKEDDDQDDDDEESLFKFDDD